MPDIASRPDSKSRLLDAIKGVFRLAKGLRKESNQNDAPAEFTRRDTSDLTERLQEYMRENAAILQHSSEIRGAADGIQLHLSELAARFSDVPGLTRNLEIMRSRLKETAPELELVEREARRNMKRAPFLLKVNAPILAEPDQSVSFTEILRRLEDDYPKVFPIWKVLFDNAIPLYLNEPDANLSTVKHPTAGRFKEWVGEHAYGRLLDIGCGPEPVPYYLEGYDLRLVAGLDPLEGREAHPFQFYRGCAEYLPWPDHSFESVVIATSLDHVISLHKTLSEIKRILVPSGVLILWLGFIPGGKYFDPHPENEPTPIDKYHLFHFDRPWFEEIMSEYFVFETAQHIDIEQSFYVYSKSEI